MGLGKVLYTSLWRWRTWGFLECVLSLNFMVAEWGLGALRGRGWSMINEGTLRPVAGSKRKFLWSLLGYRLAVWYLFENWHTHTHCIYVGHRLAGGGDGSRRAQGLHRVPRAVSMLIGEGFV